MLLLLLLLLLLLIIRVTSLKVGSFINACRWCLRCVDSENFLLCSVGRKRFLIDNEVEEEVLEVVEEGEEERKERGGRIGALGLVPIGTDCPRARFMLLNAKN